MATAAAVLPPLDYTTLKSKMNKKSSFEEAVEVCVRELSQSPLRCTSPDFRQLLKRAVTVLSSRCSSGETPLWSAGLRLVRAAAAACPADDTAYLATLRSYEVQVLQVLGADADSSTAPSYAVPRLFEGQLTTAETAAAVPPSALEALAAMFLQGQELQQQQGADDGTASSTGEDAAPAAAESDAAPAALPSLSPEMAEALQRQLDAIAVEIMEESAAAGGGARAPPPAAKDVVRRLPRKRVEKASEMDGPCPVCLVVEDGEEISELPCGHWAHPQCLEPWLKETNTCPQCRHQLKTDDAAYERRKEREKEEAEERRGVENAVSHNEFLYI